MNYFTKEKKVGKARFFLAIHKHWLGIGFGINTSNQNSLWLELSLLIIHVEFNIVK